MQAEARIDIAHEMVPGGADIGQGKVAGQLKRLHRLQLAPRGQLFEGRISGAPTEFQRLQNTSSKASSVPIRLLQP